MPRKGEISAKTRNIVWALSAGRCQFENCNIDLIGHLAAANRGANKGYQAHIIPASEGGPRGETGLSAERANDPDNIMLLCDPCHREIDKENREFYPVERLYRMKREHEARVQGMLNLLDAEETKVIQFSAPIGPNETAVPFEDCARAVLGTHRPKDFDPIEIKIRGMRHKDSDPDYWRTELAALRRQFEDRIAWRVEAGEFRHLSIFALAPIPLLIELGRLVSDITDASVYQRHRACETWRWPEVGQPIGFETFPGPEGPKRVALKLEITSEIDDYRVRAALPESDVSIWSIRASEFGHDVVTAPDALANLRRVAARTFDEIKNRHGMDVDLSVFPAVPASCAVEYGRAWQPKAHPGFIIFDQAASAGFLPRHTVEP